MKIFVAFVALVAVAAAFPNKPAFSQDTELAAIIAAINSPNTDPATAFLLEQQLQAILSPEPISVGPEIIDFPLPDAGAVTTPVKPTPPVVPSPVVIGPIAPGAPAPLVQLIVNVNPRPGVGGVIAPPQSPNAPIFVDEADNTVVDPINVVDLNPVAELDPVQIVDLMPVVEVDPVQVVDIAPIVIEPVQIGTPVFPSPAVNLPDELN